MANSLLDILNEALRVSNGRGTSQPARTLASAPTQPAQARPDIYVRNNQPRRPARRRSLWSRGFDQLNPFDNNLTWKQETPTQSKSAFQQGGQLGGQLARGMFTAIPQTINSSAELAGDTVDLARAGVAGLTNNKAAMNAALNRGLQSKYSSQGQGVLGTGGLITSEKAQKPIPAGDLTKTIVGKGVQGYAEVASLGAGGFAGKQLVQQGFKQGIRSQVPVLVKTGALNAVQGGADTYNQGGSAKDVLKSAAINTVLGTAADVGLGVAGAATTKLVKSGMGNLKPLNQGGYIRLPGKETELMVTHNLSADNLTHAQKLGGIPQPSIGIVNPRKAAIDGFGDITLVGNNNLVDPKIRGTRTFGADVYSPRQPKGVLKKNTDTSKKLMAKFEPAMKKYTDSNYLNLESADSIDEALRNETSVMAQFLEDNKIKPDQAKLEINNNTLNNQMRQAGLSQQEKAQFVVDNFEKLGNLDDMSKTKAFLKSKGIKPKAAINRADDRYTFSRQIREAGLQDNFDKYVINVANEAGASNKIFAGYTPSGTPRWLDENMDNVLKTMRKEKVRAGEGGFFGSGDGATNAKLTKEYRSLDQIVKDKDRIVTSDDMEKVKEAISKQRETIQQELQPLAKHTDSNQFTEYDNQMEAINDYLAGDKTWFSQKFPDAPESVIKKLDKLRDDIKNTPTEYFESVSDRAVKLNEFEKALIPEGLPKTQKEAIVAQLNKEGIQPRFYKDGQRQQALIDLMEQDNVERGFNKPTKNKLGLKKLNEGGYARLPGKKDPLESLKQEASDYSVKLSSKGNIYIKKADGEVVTKIPKTIQGDLYAKAQGEILTPDRARKLDDWITKNIQSSKPAPVQSSPLESLKQEATPNILEQRKQAERAYKEYQKLVQKYQGKPKAAEKLSASEKASIDKLANEYKDTFTKYYKENGGFETGTGYLKLTDDKGVDLYNQAHTQPPTPNVEAPQPTVAPTAALKQYGWSSKQDADGTHLFNANGKHVATIKQGKNGRLTSYYNDGEKMGSAGGSIDQYAEKIATQQFYAKKIEATPQNTGGTLRPDMKPIPTTDANKAMTADTDAAYKKQVDQRFAEADKRTKEMMAEMKWQKAREKFNTAEEYHLSEVDRLYKKYKNKTGYADSDMHRLKRRIINDHFDELDPETQVYFEHMAPGTDFENISKPSYRGFADASGGSGTEGVHASQIYELEQVVDEIRSADLYNQATGTKAVRTDLPDYSKLTNEDAARPAEFNAVAATAGSKNAKKLEQQLVSDKRITDKLKEAQISGKEVNFYAKKDPNGRSVGIEQFDPTQHRIESGFVVDNNGKVLGNHIKVDETGVQVNVGGDIVNMDAVIGNPTDWAGSYRVMETMDRNIKRNAPDEATYRKTREFLIDNKIKNEANFREELRAQRTSLGKQAQDVQSVRPSGVSKDEFNSDVFDFIEGKLSNVDIKAKYGDGAKAILDYKANTRKVYDDLLDRVNEVFAKYGEAPVPKRKDYITHINELNNKPNFAGEMFGQLQNSFLGEGMQSTRKGVPGEIAGRTETFEPRKRWNRFFQQRKGGEFSKDPFKAVDAYLEPTLYNIHMTESSVRARAIESAFRTADEIRNMDKNTVSKTLSDELDKYHNGDNAKLITGFQEFANALAGKTQRLDRQIIDTSKGAELGLRGWQQLQRVGGRGTILGNAQSVLSQTLGQPLALADTGIKNYLKGVASSMTGNTPIGESAFIKARSTKVTSPFRSTGTKILDAGGVPLEKVELAMVKNTWNAEYHKAVEKGFKGKKAILEADRTTEQVVAGRGIADQPEAYRSTAANGFLQYTLEVAANNKKFWQDLSPSQKATYVAAVFGANTAFGLVTGYEPLPDFLGATIDTAQDFRDPNDTRTGVQKAVGGAQRYASESVEMNPLATAGVNTLLNQDQRKAVFGQDSSLSRFEGTAAPVQVIRNTADAAINLTKGRYGKAASSAVKNLPFGNQTNKTVTGAAMINRGYAVDSAGNPTFPAPTDAVGRAQALLFGPNSTKAAQNFYSNNQGSVSGKTDLATLNASSNKSKTLAEIQQRRLSDNKIDKAVDERVKKVLPDAEQSLRNNPAFSKLSPEDQVKKLTKLTDDIRAVEKRKYMADNKVGEYANDFKGKESKLTKSQRDLLTNGVDTAKYIKSSDVGELPAGMNGYDVQTLERFAGLSDTEKDDIIRKEKDAEYKLTLAKYERDKKLGKISKVEDLKRSKELKRAKAGSDFEKEIREFYTLNKGEINNYVSSSPDGKTVAEKLLAYDDALVAAGVIEKNKFRDKYGNPKFDTKTSGSGKSKKGKKGKKGGKGRKGSTKGRYDYKLFAFKTPKNTQKSLRELVKKATL